MMPKKCCDASAGACVLVACLCSTYAPRFFAALDGEQEWWVGHDFIAGRFPQLVLTEYFYYAREKTCAGEILFVMREQGLSTPLG